MTVNVGKELAALRRMSVDELRSRYAEVFGETTNGRHKEWLIKQIIYRMQVLAEGDLSDRARRRAAELANDADLRRRPPKSPPPKAEDLIDEADVAKAMAEFDPVWESLSPREQGRLLQLLIERIDYDGHDGMVSITFHAGGIKALANHEFAGDAA